MFQVELQLLSADDVAQLVEVAWHALYDSPLARVVPDDLEHPGMIYVSVSVGGPKNVTVRLHCSPELARRYTAAVLGTEYHDSDETDVLDVLGELANIIGGNYKGAVSDGDSAWSLSLPVISRTSQELPRSRVNARVSFLCEGDLIECHVLERA